MKKEATTIIILIILVILLATIGNFLNRDIEEADAAAFVLSDLNSKYPFADNEIISVAEKTNQQGEKYFEIKAKVTEGGNSACPKRTHYYYNYPEQNFVAQPPKVITENCRICLESTCVIAFPEQAIVASHVLNGSEDVNQYLADYPDALVEVEDSENWVVTWDSDSALYYYIVEISRSGNLLSLDRSEKS